MLTVASILLIIISVVLILVVLVQPGKGDMISGMSGLGGAFSSMMGSRRAMDLLTKITIGLAAAIMIFSLLTNMFFVGGEENMPRPAIEKFEVPQSVPQNIPATPDVQVQEPNQLDQPTEEQAEPVQQNEEEK